MKQGVQSEVVEDFELAFARLEWARAAACLDLPSQREALEWHVACFEAALSAIGDASTSKSSA